MKSFVFLLMTVGIWGVVPYFEKMGLEKVDPMVGLFYRCLGVTLGLLVLGLGMLKPSQIFSVHWKSSVWLVAAGFLAAFVAQIAFYQALKTDQISKVVPIAGSYPFVTFCLGIVFLGESFSLQKLAGAVLIVTGIWCLKLG